MMRTVTPVCGRVRALWTRQFHASHCRSTASNSTTNNVREALRALLQHTAQPVSVLTLKNASTAEKSTAGGPWHGATLSSFSSISFHPFPIVAFALQLPSRSADALQTHFAQSSSSSTSSTAATEPKPHLVINILSSTQSDLAARFSRPDLYPKPFSDLDTIRHVTPRYTLTNEGIPKFTDALGVLSCSLIASLPLNAAASDPHRLAHAIETHALPPGSEVRPGSSSSMLYLARVVRVEETERTEGTGEEGWPLPLLYHRKAYSTVASGPASPPNMSP